MCGVKPSKSHIHGGVPGLLLDVRHDVDGLVCDLGELVAVGLLELLEDDGGLVAVGRAHRQTLDALAGDEAGGFGHFVLFLGGGFGLGGMVVGGAV